MGKKKKANKIPEEKPPVLRVTPEQQKKIDEFIEATKKGNVTTYWDEKITKYLYVPVDDGEIRVVHVKPEKTSNKRILVFMPGWGVQTAGFDVLYETLHDEVEFYYIETREKGTSKLNKKKANMSIEQMAKDVQDALNFLELPGKDFVFVTPCWGATIIFIGILNETFKAPSIVVFDPMHKLWFNKFINTISPAIPVWLANIVKRPIKFFALLGMKEKAQKERTSEFIDNADIWKWKNAAHAVKDLELFGKLEGIKQEIIVFNATSDRIHNQEDYPKLATELPNGRFFFMNTDESKRERLMSGVIRELVAVDGKTNIPPVLTEFEKKLDRSS
ncbi:MAG: hypothetical protein ACTSO7_01510 [Candidatus Heimdallarchaeota archaeon]